MAANVHQLHGERRALPASVEAANRDWHAASARCARRRRETRMVTLGDAAAVAVLRLRVRRALFQRIDYW